MPAFDLIALDLDDTLLRGDLTISSRNIAALERCRRAGVRLTFASGRMLSSMEPLAAELNLDAAVIAYNGAMVAELPSRRILSHHPLPPGYAAAIIAVLRREGVHVNLYVQDRLYMEHDTPEGRQYMAQSGVRGHIAPFTAALESEPTKLVAIDSPACLDEMLAKFQIEYPDLHITKSKPHYLEFMRGGVHKGAGLAALARHYHVARNRIIAVGDAPNDLEMLEFAGLGIAMGNAHEALKRRFHPAAPSNEADGVAWVIDRLVLSDVQQ